MEGRWADGRCRQQGARERGAAGERACGADGARGRQGVRAAGAQGGRCEGGRRVGVQGMRGRAAGRAVGALLGARSSQGTGAVRAAMHGLGAGWVCWLGQLG